MHAVRRLVLVLASALLLTACGGGDDAAKPPPSAPTTMKLTSPRFANGAVLPQFFTCDGPSDTPPPLHWGGAPRGTKEFALIVEDPDAGNFVHWSVLKLSPLIHGVPGLPAFAVQTENGEGKHGWTPACPPKGDRPHRYVFTVYAVDAPLDVDENSSIGTVNQQLADHALARGVLTARYGR
jgi:Raf kinase inhibitor-like YbhB/YbcL family protein